MTPPTIRKTQSATPVRTRFAWWKRRTGLEKILSCAGIVIVAVAAWHFYSQYQSSNREADVGNEVKTSMQQTFDTDQRFAQYHLVVSKVDVMHKSDNDYEGLATVHSPENVDHTVTVHITAEGDRVMWKSDPGAFTWAAFESSPNSIPTPAAAPPPAPAESPSTPEAAAPPVTAATPSVITQDQANTICRWLRDPSWTMPQIESSTGDMLANDNRNYQGRSDIARAIPAAVSSTCPEAQRTS
jgi:hypothetical protein